MKTEILLGNEAIGLALVEQGCRVATSYPGTPGTEILASVLKYKKQFNRQIFAEWSVNEKVAFEVALAASWTGLRSAASMKQAGLNVACDSFFNAAYTGVKGGFLIVSADDPGPVVSQTEQDSRLFALTAKVPVFDPSSINEAYSMVRDAFELSERHRIPVMLRPVTRVCHAIQNLTLDNFPSSGDPMAVSQFERDPPHFAATSGFRYMLHTEVNKKIAAIESEFIESAYNYKVNADVHSKIGIIASGVVFHTVKDVLDELGIVIPILKIGTPYPLPKSLVEKFLADYETVIVLEETDVCVELQLPNRSHVRGRLDGTVPNAGELTPDVVTNVLDNVFSRVGLKSIKNPERKDLPNLTEAVPLPSRRPSLCPGCSHRSVFFILRQEFGGDAIYPGDIGCNTLGVNLKAVDTFLVMGASVSMANGFYQANRLSGINKPIIATIGDSTFLHAGIPPLLDAVHTGARFVLLILDNHVVAMTGFQPTTGNGLLADGTESPRKVSMLKLAQACGVGFAEEVDPYDQELFRKTVRSAYNHTQAPEGGVAVVIANHPCVLKNLSSIRYGRS